jgi:class 3 adenylate cyclase
MRAKFGSVVDAVECAVSLQRGLAERNAAVTEDQRIRVKIGSLPFAASAASDGGTADG